MGFHGVVYVRDQVERPHLVESPARVLYRNRGVETLGEGFAKESRLLSWFVTESLEADLRSRAVRSPSS